MGIPDLAYSEKSMPRLRGKWKCAGIIPDDDPLLLHSQACCSLDLGWHLSVSTGTPPLQHAQQAACRHLHARAITRNRSARSLPTGHLKPVLKQSSSFSGTSSPERNKPSANVAGQWSTLAPLPQSKDDMALAALPDQRLLVMGGETHLNTSRDQVPSLW